LAVLITRFSFAGIFRCSASNPRSEISVGGLSSNRPSWSGIIRRRYQGVHSIEGAFQNFDYHEAIALRDHPQPGVDSGLTRVASCKVRPERRRLRPSMRA
jgi:hypothetical protein